MTDHLNDEGVAALEEEERLVARLQKFTEDDPVFAAVAKQLAELRATEAYKRALASPLR